MPEETSGGRSAAVVLVHGAWHGGWCWDRVAGPLRDAGLVVYTPDLPSPGSMAPEPGDLATDAASISTLLDSIEGPVVLVGHSYGGAVITQAGDHPAVSHLVYVCAFALDDGESCMTAAASLPETAAISHDNRTDVSAGFIPSEDGTATSLMPEVALAALYNDCDAETAAWAIAQLRPQTLVALSGVPNAIAWRSCDSTYVVCTDDQIIHPDLQRILARRCTSSVEWPTSHSPFLSCPDLAIELLRELAQSVGG
jgi:pimeloyl-ACP methyl ester carboxylesterase